MEQKEINRLKEICEKEGFQLVSEKPIINHGISTIMVMKKDEWEGVEFAQCLFDHDPIKKDVIVKINRIKQANNDRHFHIFFNTSECEKYSHVNNFKPSTEQAYKAQLIKEAKERFGEINNGDLFDISEILGYSHKASLTILKGEIPEYDYYKKEDILSFHGFRLYEKGKWAKKITKPEIKVEYTGWEYQPRFHNAINIGFKVPQSFVMSVRLGELLAEFIKNHMENEKTC